MPYEHMKLSITDKLNKLLAEQYEAIQVHKNGIAYHEGGILESESIIESLTDILADECEGE